MKKILLSSVLCASMMFAANSEYKYELTPFVGTSLYEGNTDLQGGWNGGISLGFNLDDSMFDQVELGFLRSLGDVDYIWKQAPNTPYIDTGVSRIFTSLIKEYPIYHDLKLYGLVGAGIEIFDDESYGNKNGLFGSYGIGMKWKIFEETSLRVDYRHIIETDHGDNSLLTTIGLSIPFGKKAAAPAPMPMKKAEPKPMDSDGDGVIDAKDSCPNSPAGAIVNAQGCEIDSDMDGVVDRLDQCPNTPKGDIVDAKGCSLKVDLNINFETDSAVINNEYSSKIKKFADFMKAFPAVKGKIEAHTDSVGSDAYNQKLSERRAASAVKALEEQGIDASRLNSVGYGEMNPKASNETAEGRTMNRRVEGSIQK